jgi:lipid A 4'-phosphatase
MNRTPVVVGLALGLLLTAAVFSLWPDVDLAAAQVFYVGQNRFIGQTELGEVARRIAYWVPTAALAACAACYLARRLGLSRGWAPTGRGLAMLAVSFAVGPGLLTNTILKDHSHRPRPYQTLAFGGADTFKPFYTFDGACARNCSFVSGEGSAAFWMIAPALLLPPPAQAAAVAGTLLFGAGVGTLRMAFGGHYLSDTLFAALLTWVVIFAVWCLVVGRRRAWQPGALSARSDAAPEPDGEQAE